jgi:hypothetical protein
MFNKKNNTKNLGLKSTYRQKQKALELKSALKMLITTSNQGQTLARQT